MYGRMASHARSHGSTCNHFLCCVPLSVSPPLYETGAGASTRMVAMRQEEHVQKRERMQQLVVLQLIVNTRTRMCSPSTPLLLSFYSPLLPSYQECGRQSSAEVVDWWHREDVRQMILRILKNTMEILDNREHVQLQRMDEVWRLQRHLHTSMSNTRLLPLFPPLTLSTACLPTTPPRPALPPSLLSRAEMEALIGEGTTLVVDRYSFSGIAFSAAKGLDVQWCKSTEVGLPAPDIVIYLDIDPQVLPSSPSIISFVIVQLRSGTCIHPLLPAFHLHASMIHVCSPCRLHATGCIQPIRSMQQSGVGTVESGTRRWSFSSKWLCISIH
ncbi:unnamed protein product [Closterium sp. NIES-54]